PFVAGAQSLDESRVVIHRATVTRLQRRTSGVAATACDSACSEAGNRRRQPVPRADLGERTALDAPPEDPAAGSIDRVQESPVAAQIRVAKPGLAVDPDSRDGVLEGELTARAHAVSRDGTVREVRREHVSTVARRDRPADLAPAVAD